MGVSMMFTYVKGHADCVEYVDLVQMAVDMGGIKLLVDFYSWEHFIQARFKDSLDLKTDNPFLILCGGEYRLIRNYMTSFIAALRSVNIEPIFFLDGAKGSSDQGAARKWNTWMKRQTRDTFVMKKTLKLLLGHTPFKEFNLGNLTRPCLQEVQNITTLLHLGCKVQTVLSGEADTVIAKYMLQDSKTVAVFTNDTDFCIFPGSVFLSDTYFDIQNDLEMVDQSLSIKRPKQLICGLVKSDRLWRHFKFPDVSSLCEVAILAGNDFTSPIISQIDELGGYIGKVAKVAELVRQHGSVENFPVFQDSLTNSPDLQRAVQHSREFYSLSLPDDKDEHTGDVTQLIISKAIREIRYPGTIFSMYKKFYWHRMILEDSRQSGTTAERAMVFLRCHIYSLLLPPEEDVVKEYGRTPEINFLEMMAHKVTKMPLPSLSVIQKNSLNKNKVLFHMIMSHQEQAKPMFTDTYFHIYGNNMGFTCYLLRYFLMLNWQQNLHIKPGEFLLVCAWLLGNHNPEEYVYHQVLPSVRCITIENWMLCLYRTAHAFLGSVLNLTSEFPVPADLFSGAVWVNLYSASHLSPKGHRKCADVCPLMSREHIRAVDSRVMSTLNEHIDVVETVVKNIFSVKL